MSNDQKSTTTTEETSSEESKYYNLKGGTYTISAGRESVTVTVKSDEELRIEVSHFMQNILEQLNKDLEKK